jgi:Uma2 family endonuclease
MPQARDARSPDKRYTYEDYCSWPETARWELLDGVPLGVTSPSVNHQEVLLKLARQLDEQLEGKPCRPLVAPVDVLLPKSDEEDERVNMVVQPDLVVYCDEEKIRPRNCRGAPDLVIEVLSLSTSSVDHIRKKAIYEHAGVREYWLVHPDEGVITVYVRQPAGGFGASRVFCRDDQLAVQALPGVTIDFEKVYARIPNPVVVKEPPPHKYPDCPATPDHTTN